MNKDAPQLVIRSLFKWGARIGGQVRKKNQAERKEGLLALSLTSVLVKLFFLRDQVISRR